MVAVSRDWNLLYVRTRTNRKEKEETEVKVDLMISKRNCIFPRNSAMMPPASTATALRYALQCPSRKRTNLSPDGSSQDLGGWFRLSTMLIVSHTLLPRSLVRQLPPSSVCSQAAQQVPVTVSQLQL